VHSQLLIFAGADPTINGQDRASCLHMAVTCQGNLEIVEMLLSRGADPNARNPANITPIMTFFDSTSKHASGCEVASDPCGIIRCLAKHGADINAHDGEYRLSALHHAILSDAPAAIIQTLLQLGADPRLKCNEGCTALDVAKRFDHTAAQMVLRRAMRQSKPAASQAAVSYQTEEESLMHEAALLAQEEREQFEMMFGSELTAQQKKKQKKKKQKEKERKAAEEAAAGARSSESAEVSSVPAGAAAASSDEDRATAKSASAKKRARRKANQTALAECTNVETREALAGSAPVIEDDESAIASVDSEHIRIPVSDLNETNDVRLHYASARGDLQVTEGLPAAGWKKPSATVSANEMERDAEAAVSVEEVSKSAKHGARRNANQKQKASTSEHEEGGPRGANNRATGADSEARARRVDDEVCYTGVLYPRVQCSSNISNLSVVLESR